MNISVCGTGYVGLVTGAWFAEFSVHVTCMDKDERRIAQLDKGEIPIYEPGLAELVRKGLSEGRLIFTTDLGQAVEAGLAIFIAVGTPSREDGSADLSFVEEVGRGIAAHLNGYKVIVTKSTVPVGSGQRLRELLEQHGPPTSTSSRTRNSSAKARPSKTSCAPTEWSSARTARKPRRSCATCTVPCT